MGGKADDLFGIIGSEDVFRFLFALQTSFEIGVLLPILGDGSVQIMLGYLPHAAFPVSIVREGGTKHECTTRYRVCPASDADGTDGIRLALADPYPTVALVDDACQLAEKVASHRHIRLVAKENPRSFPPSCGGI